MALQHPFRILDLPLEIRCQVYRLALPSQNTPRRSSSVASSYCFSLLLANRQICAEAHEFLYGRDPFTVAISADRTYFLHRHDIVVDFRPFKPIMPMRYIKNWHFDLQFNPSYNSYDGYSTARAPHLGSSLGNDQYYIREGLLGISAALAEQDTDLQTLSIRIPCLCGKAKEVPDDRARFAVIWSIEPLELLKFKSSVTLIATRGEEEGATGTNDRKTSPNQCQQKPCLAFADSFADVVAVIRDVGVPPLSLTPRQTHWLQLKKRAATLLPKIEPTTRFQLHRVWAAMETHSDEQFMEEVDEVSKWIGYEFDRRMMNGRYQRYSDFQRWGIPEEEWY